MGTLISQRIMPACSWNRFSDCDCRDCRWCRDCLHPGAVNQKEVLVSVPQLSDEKRVTRELPALDMLLECDKHRRIEDTSFSFTSKEKRGTSGKSQ